jgi:hypothetical protein
MWERRGSCRIFVGKTGEGDHLEDSGVDGRIILKWTFEKWDGGLDCIDLAQDRERWWAFVNAGNFLAF